MSETVTLVLIGLTVLCIGLVNLAAMFYVPKVIAPHDDRDDHVV